MKRLRKPSDLASVMSSTTLDTSNPEEKKSLLSSSPQKQVGCHNVEPLIQRSLWSRLDVAPFCFLYGFLFILDHTPSSSDLVRYLKMMAFPLALVTHLFVVLVQQWSVSFRCKVGYFPARTSSTKEWTHCLIESPTQGGSKDSDVVPVQQHQSVVTVTFHDIVFRCTMGPDDEMDGLWRRTPQEDGSLFHRLRFPVDLPLEFYRKEWRGHVSLDSVRRSHKVYGSNTTKIQLPAFLDLLGEQLLAPFFLFQLFCVVLWSLDEYWYYAIFTLFALIMFECTVAFNRLKSLERLRGTLHHHYHVSANRHGVWMLLRTDELVPGDLISLTTSTQKQQAYVPADMLVLDGTAVVDEALLTGESIPQRKGPLDDASPNGSLARLDMQDPLHKQSILFGGTLLISHGGEENRDYPKPPDNGILCMVLKTGFETTQGSLLRTMAHSSMKSADGIHTRDTFFFVAILLFCAVISAISVLQQGWNDETRNRFRLVLHVVIIVTSVVPPELPMELSLAVTNSVADLMRNFCVFCTEPYRIPWAGRVDVCCFDKTGTLTSDEMQLKGVRFLSSDPRGSCFIHPTETELPWESLRVMVACQSLTVSGDRRDMMGDPLELALMQDSGYTLRGSNFVVAKETKPGFPRGIFIHHRFAFSSKLQRMTVLLTEDNSPEIFGVMKGAPETVKAFLKSVPEKYDDVCQNHMNLGQRVLAMAFRSYGHADISDLKERGRVSLEKDFTFCGFLVLDCPLKVDSKHIISELKTCEYETVMITGDAVLTGAEVARQVGIIGKGSGLTYELQSCESEVSNNCVLAGFEFVPLSASSSSSSKTLPAIDLAKLREMKDNSTASFCLSGAVMAKIGTDALKRAAVHVSPMDYTSDDSNLLLHPVVQHVLKDLVQVVSVFARHTPRQKEAVIAAFNLAGKHTMMTGDGTNDVGALKRAHVGISIISAPSLEAKQREATDAIFKEQKREKKARKERKAKKKNSRLEQSFRILQEAQKELDHVELGDASMASPFTSRVLSIKCCKDVLLQGRCTLVVMMTIYKILGVNCLVNALVLTKLHMHGVKQGDRQLTIIGVVVAALFLFVTRGKPLSTLSPTRPPASVLCLQTLFSIAAQFAVHFTLITIVTDMAERFVDPFDPSIIPDAAFNPNILNSCTFLLTMIATINTFAINYRGKPFMEDFRENKLLLRSTQACYAIAFACSLEVFPPLNDLFQLAPFPTIIINEVGSDDDWTAVDSSSKGLVTVVRHLGFPVAMSMFMVVDTILSYVSEKTVLFLFP